MIELSYPRRILATVLAGAVLLPVTVYLGSASVAVATVRAARDEAILAPSASRGAPVTAVASAVVRRAMAARPFDQSIANVAMVRAVRQGGAKPGAWMPTIAQLGWRDTAAQLNRLYVAGGAGDVATILDVSESLLRRRQLADQITPILAIVETDPQIRPQLVGRLHGGPAWREPYLEAAGVLTRREQFAARYAILRELMRRGDRLTEGEVSTNVAALERGNLPNLGFALWSAAHPGVHLPLNDPDFRQAAATSAKGDDAVPYEWQLLSGEGYGADAFVEDGRSALQLRWNGRGVPVFARQRTSARPGRYLLDIRAAPEDAGDLSTIGFRLVCNDVIVDFRQDGTSPTRRATSQPVPCAYPVMEIAGDIQSSSVTRSLTLYSLRLRPAA